MVATPRKYLAAGIDPSIKRKLDKQAAGNTFRVVAEELLKKLEREGRAPATLAKQRWLLEFALAAFGKRPIAEITAPEILALLHTASLMLAEPISNGFVIGSAACSSRVSTRPSQN